MNARRITLSVVLIVVAACAVFGQAAARFEVASIKPNTNPGPGVITGIIRPLPGGRLSANAVLPRFIIQFAYAIRPYQISGGPDWINSAHYDIEAKAEGNATPQQIRLMTQSLLEDRFKLKAHRETRELPVYDLTVSRSGLKLLSPKEGSCVTPDPNGPPLVPAPGQAPTPVCGAAVVTITPSGARILGGKVSMASLTPTLSNLLGRTVIDKTGFTGTFDVDLQFAPDQALAVLPPPGPPGAPGATAPATDPAGPSIFTAIQEQLGLKLDSGKGPVEVLVIDSVEKPTEN